MKKILLIGLAAVLAVGCGAPASNSVMNSAVSNANNANHSNANSHANSPAGNATPHSSPAAANANAITPTDGKGPHSVKFAHGATSASYSGSFAGYDYVDYVLDAKAGQTLSAEFTHNDPKHAIMTIMQKDLKIADDSAETDKWSGKLPADGSYTIRVGQMRNDARRGNTPVKFTLKISIT